MKHSNEPLWYTGRLFLRIMIYHIYFSQILLLFARGRDKLSTISAQAEQRKPHPAARAAMKEAFYDPYRKRSRISLL
jgi:hypothetical protein